LDIGYAIKIITRTEFCAVFANYEQALHVYPRCNGRWNAGWTTGDTGDSEFASRDGKVILSTPSLPGLGPNSLLTSGDMRALSELVKLTLSNPTSDLVRQYDFPLLHRCRKTSDTVFVAFARPLSEPVRRFSSCSTDFSQQIAQVVLFLYLNDFFF
jgi:hypothetical protein